MTSLHNFTNQITANHHVIERSSYFMNQAYLGLDWDGTKRSSDEPKNLKGRIQTS